MRVTRLVESILVFLAIGMTFAAPVLATDGGFDLPSTFVRMEVRDGTESYFNITLSEVPPGYDVANTTYRGWCIDVRTPMIKSPATHAVFLYSSLNAPGELAGEEWDMINYILNHKQGSVQDIQQAIWYFMHMGGEYNPNSTVAWTIVNDALENGGGFVSGPGQVTAIICYPTILFPNEPEVQITIIEVGSTPAVPEFPSATLILAPTMIIVLIVALICNRK